MKRILGVILLFSLLFNFLLNRELEWLKWSNDSIYYGIVEIHGALRACESGHLKEYQAKNREELRKKMK